MVIDDSVLNSPHHADVGGGRKVHTFKTVYSLLDTTFMPYASVKTSIIVLGKKHYTAEHELNHYLRTV
ncbi:hypothetical protein [Sporosarcina ureilytica]|uniref:Uncharacterized protein n=1 Tax=Sporosarcina ureilytica TaxID=298596 RepID=A0A1D8JFL2_9BACL|nr:hypothetical protein [Sporosarcina ureilytica]AOV07489.1 hypothetical protein BI350_08035 [Sporosarcina ureilytica]